MHIARCQAAFSGSNITIMIIIIIIIKIAMSEWHSSNVLNYANYFSRTNTNWITDLRIGKLAGQHGFIEIKLIQ